MKVENRYKGIRSPHKMKSAVSGCVRECAEAQGKDFGMIATENGYNLYVGGNGGVNPVHAELLAADIDEDTVLKYVDRYLMYYILTADKLERTAPWQRKLPNGKNGGGPIEHLKEVIIEDSLGICNELDKRMAHLVDTMLTEPAEGNVYRVDKLANRMGFNRQLAAAVSIASPSHKIDPNTGMVEIHRYDVRRPSSELVNAITATDENIDRAMIGGGGGIGKTANSFGNNTGTAGELNSTAALCAKPVPWSARDDHRQCNVNEAMTTTSATTTTIHRDREEEDSIRDTIRLALDKYGAFEGLNASQRLAVDATNRLTLVQGPPGTGKTAVAIAFCHRTHEIRSQSKADAGNLRINR